MNIVMKALEVKSVDHLGEPHYMGFSVYFGMGDDYRGVLNKLDNSIKIWSWCRQHAKGEFWVERHQVIFVEEDDAHTLYLEFSNQSG